jgi:SAM-dependent methyltransferase
MSINTFNGGFVPLQGSRRKAFNQFNEMVYSGAIKTEIVEVCFCGEVNFEILGRYDRFGLPFGTKICKSCGLITQTRRINPESLPVFYEKIYWPLVSSSDNFLTAPKKDETLSYVLKHLQGYDSEVRVFEVGCGSGGRIAKLRDELLLAGHKVSAYGCDYSSDAINLAVKKDIRAIHGGMNELRVAGKADILILSHVFEHFPDLALALEQIEMLIHEKSIIYIEVPGVLDLENKKEYLFDYQLYCVLAHTFNFSLDTLCKVMSSRGFQLIEGDEYVRAVFRKGPKIVKKDESPSAYEKTINSLFRANVKYQALARKRNNWFIRRLRNIAKALLGQEG